MGSVRDIVLDNVSRFIKDSGMEQKQIAEKLGISAAAITNWMQRKNTPDIEMLFRLCDVLGKTIYEMLGNEKPAMQQHNGPLYDDDEGIISMLPRMSKGQRKRLRAVADILFQEDTLHKE